MTPEEVYRAHEPLAIYLAGRALGLDPDDARQEARLSLWRLVPKYRADAPKAFRVLAYKTIRWHLIREAKRATVGVVFHKAKGRKTRVGIPAGVAASLVRADDTSAVKEAAEAAVRDEADSIALGCLLGEYATWRDASNRHGVSYAVLRQRGTRLRKRIRELLS